MRARPLRRSLALLVDSFAFVLVMIAFLFLSAAFGLIEGESAFETIRRITLCRARARADRRSCSGSCTRACCDPGSGTCCSSSRRIPTRSTSATRSRATLRDPSLELAYWLPDFESYADLDGRPVALPTAEDGRAVTLIERDGAPVAALVHDPSLARRAGAPRLGHRRRGHHARERPPPGRPAGPRRRARGVAAPGDRGRAQRSANVSNATSTTAHSSAWSRCRSTSGVSHDRCSDDADAHRESRSGARPGRELARRAARRRARHPPGGRERARARRSRSRSWPRTARSRSSSTVELDGRLPEPVEVAAYYVVSESLANVGKHAHATSASVNVGRATGDRSSSRSSTTVSAVPTPKAAPDSAGSPTASRRSAAASASGRRRGQRHPGQGGDPVRVVIAEDSVLLREGIERLLADNGFEVVGTLRRRPTRCWTWSSTRAPDVAIVDIRLPPTHNDEGLQAALEIRGALPDGRRARALAVPRARPRVEAARRSTPTASATSSRTASATSPSSSRRCGASPTAAPRSTRSSCRSC